MVLLIVIGPMSFAEFLKALLGPLFFNIFINDIFLVVEKSDICNFADDNTLFSHDSSFPLILNNLEHDMKNLPYWFKINLINESPGKFNDTWEEEPFKIKKIETITIRESLEIELLGITIDRALNFKKHI